LSALAAIAVFPVLTILLVCLTKADDWASGAASFTGRSKPADPPPVATDENPSG